MNLKVWKNESEKQEAKRVRAVHPEWDNAQIKAFMLGMEENKQEQLEAKLAKIDSIGKRGTIDEPDIFSIPLREFIDNNRTPTGYVSPLNDVDWVNYYLGASLFGGGRLYETQMEISNHFDKYLWAAADVWRGIGKTVLSFGKMTRKMCDNPSIKLYMICEDQPRAKARLGVIKQIFQQNRLIIRDYGYLPHDKQWDGYKGKWTGFKIQLKRDIIAQEPTLTALSQGSDAMLGYHFDGGIIDDPWSDKLQRQKNAKENWLSWFQGTFLGCIEAGAFSWMLFTRKGVNDLYSDIIYKKGLFKPFTKPAILNYPSKYEYVVDAKGFPVYHRDPVMPFYPKGYGVPKVLIISNDGKINDPCHGRFSMEYLLGKRQQQGKLKFEQEYQCNPTPVEGAILDWNALKFYNDINFKIEPYEYPNYDSISWIAFMDQAYGMMEGSDYTVISIIGVYAGRIYLDWIFRGRWDVNQKIAKIREAFAKYPKLTKMGIESGFTQTAWAKMIIDGCPELPLVPVDQRGKGRDYKAASLASDGYEPKIMRIHDQWTPVLVKRNMFVNAMMPFFDDFEHEFRHLGNAEHDDIVDSVGSGLEMMGNNMLYKFIMSGSGGAVVKHRTF